MATPRRARACRRTRHWTWPAPRAGTRRCAFATSARARARCSPRAATPGRWWCSDRSIPRATRCARTSSCIPPPAWSAATASRIDVDAAPGAHAQLTTPGAAKWYRSSGLAARQDVVLRVRAGATLEWLPQESIVFDGAIGELDTRVELDGDAAFIGWDVVCLGRSRGGRALLAGTPSAADRRGPRRRPAVHRAREPRGR